MIYREWIDFVIFPLDPNKVLSQKTRLDTSTAVRVSDPNYTPELATQEGVIFEKEIILFDDDEFEAIGITDYGDVCIWTKKRVWTLFRRISGMEKMTYVPRHPDSEELTK